MNNVHDLSRKPENDYVTRGEVNETFDKLKDELNRIFSDIFTMFQQQGEAIMSNTAPNEDTNEETEDAQGVDVPPTTPPPDGGTDTSSASTDTDTSSNPVDLSTSSTDGGDANGE